MIKNINLLKGKTGVVTGVANKSSLAWGIAKACADAGANVILTYPNDTVGKRVKGLAHELGLSEPLVLDVSSDESFGQFAGSIANYSGGIDFVVHSIAFSKKEALRGNFLDVTRDNFLLTMDISVFSLLGLVKFLEPYINDGCSILTLSYYGAEKVVPNYNVMGVAKAALEAAVKYIATDLGHRGVRANVISAGPVKTLAASGIGNFRSLLNWSGANAPLRRNVTIEQVGSSAMFLLSDLASGITGEVLHVDSGYNTVGIVPLENMSVTDDS